MQERFCFTTARAPKQYAPILFFVINSSKLSQIFYTKYLTSS